MANYTKATNFATKDSLATGNPNKIVKGTELNSEFDAIAVAVATKQDTLPTGIIVMWSGATNAVPTGWALCNGQNGTPDLRDRFIVGAGSSYGVGNLGGNDNVTLTTSNLPAHSHTATSTVIDPGHSHSIAMGANFNGAYNFIQPTITNLGFTLPTNSSQTGITVNTTIGSTGSGTAVDIRPKYLALAYIMKL